MNNQSLDPADYVSTPAPGRDCGTCSLCCKVFEVEVLNKPLGQWCPHCTPGKGCGIHETRPAHCRAYHCFWMLAPFLGPEWKPEKARFVLSIDPHTKFLLAQVDPAQPTAWRNEPYYNQLKQWATAGISMGRQVLVFNGKAATVILPDKDVELGVIAPDERIFFTMQPVVGGGFSFNVEKRKVDAEAQG
jgi:hypothetical protein